MPSSKEEQNKLLLKCLQQGKVIRRNQDIVKIDEDNNSTHYANPEESIHCDLHIKNRVGENLSQHVLLVGTRRLLPGELETILLRLKRLLMQKV